MEFLSKKEWNEEKELILREVAYVDKEGRERFRRPEPGTDAAIGWAKILAVHGRVSWEKADNHVTRALGATYRVKDEDADAFRKKVERFIDSADVEDEDDNAPKFWPIVKLVKIKVPLPNRSLDLGTKFVDLPGVQDANEARNRIAKDYLQNCDAVWIVADIVRAVDNRTAKDLLGEAFRRQLFLDGQYANLTFVCTKSDIINAEEFVRSLKLTKETRPFQKIVDEKKALVEELNTNCESLALEIETRKDFLELNPDLSGEEVLRMENEMAVAKTNLAAKSLEKLQVNVSGRY